MQDPARKAQARARPKPAPPPQAHPLRAPSMAAWAGGRAAKQTEPATQVPKDGRDQQLTRGGQKPRGSCARGGAMQVSATCSADVSRLQRWGCTPCSPPWLWARSLSGSGAKRGLSPACLPASEPCMRPLLSLMASRDTTAQMSPVLKKDHAVHPLWL